MKIEQYCYTPVDECDFPIKVSEETVEELATLNACDDLDINEIPDDLAQAVIDFI